MNVRTSEERQNLHQQTLNNDDDDDDDDTSAKPLNCVLLALVFVQLEKCRNSPRQSRDLESGRKNRASAEDDDRGERREETRHKTPPVGRRQRCRLHDALSRKTTRHRTSCTVFPSRTILLKYNTENAYYIRGRVGGGEVYVTSQTVVRTRSLLFFLFLLLVIYIQPKDYITNFNC